MHLPRRASQEKTGTFSCQASSWPQLMQAEPGLTIERLRGTRAATTFRKLPIASAGTKTTAESATFIGDPIGTDRLALECAPCRYPE